LTQQVHDVAAAAAAGIEHAHVRLEAPAQQLVEQVDVDRPERILERHGRQGRAAGSGWPSASASGGHRRAGSRETTQMVARPASIAIVLYGTVATPAASAGSDTNAGRPSSGSPALARSTADTARPA